MSVFKDIGAGLVSAQIGGAHALHRGGTELKSAMRAMPIVPGAVAAAANPAARAQNSSSLTSEIKSLTAKNSIAARAQQKTSTKPFKVPSTLKPLPDSGYKINTKSVI